MKNYCDGGEAILQAFRDLGVDYIIASPGSEWSPVWEALARQKVNEKDGPTYLNCWHETLAVDMALAYTRVTDRLQAVLLHAGAGLQQGSLGIHSALLAEVPMVVMSGESLSFGEDPNLPIEPQWYNALSIVGGPHRLVEPIVKWSQYVASPFTLYESVVRAGEMAQRQPMGPTYLDVPLEVMLHEWTPPAKMRNVPPAPKTQAQPRDIEKVAALLTNAKQPMIVTESAGRDPQAFAALVELADLLNIPVGSRGFAYANFPTSHPLYQGSDIESVLKQADLILLVKSKAPWYPPSHRPLDATIVAIGENPLSGTMVYQSLQADFYLEGDVAVALRMLSEAVRSAGVGPSKFAARREHWKREHDKVESGLRTAEAGEQGKAAIDPVALCGAVREVMPADAVYLDETIMHSAILQKHLSWNEPQSYFHGFGGLGQGLGLALGTKLAAPKRPVVLFIGDGAFLYNPIVQAFGASRDHDLPIVVIVCNNRKYLAMQKGHIHHYPDGVAVGADLFHGVHIDGPDYAELGRPFGFHGQRVENAGELKGALQGALASVKNGTTSVLNVVLSR